MCLSYILFRYCHAVIFFLQHMIWHCIFIWRLSDHMSERRECSTWVFARVSPCYIKLYQSVSTLSLIFKSFPVFPCECTHHTYHQRCSTYQTNTSSKTHEYPHETCKKQHHSQPISKPNLISKQRLFIHHVQMFLLWIYTLVWSHFCTVQQLYKSSFKVEDTFEIHLLESTFYLTDIAFY